MGATTLTDGGRLPAALADLVAGPPTIPLPEAAALLGISRSHAYDVARKGEFPVKVVKIGTSYRVIAADLVRVLSAEGADQ